MSCISGVAPIAVGGGVAGGGISIEFGSLGDGRFSWGGLTIGGRWGITLAWNDDVNVADSCPAEDGRTLRLLRFPSSWLSGGRRPLDILERWEV